MKNLKPSLSDKFWKFRKSNISYEKACVELRLSASSGNSWRVNFLIDGLRRSKGKNIEDEIGLAMERATTNGNTDIIKLMLKKDCGKTLYKEPKTNPSFCNSGAKKLYEIKQQLNQSKNNQEELFWKTATWRDRSFCIAANGGHTDIIQEFINTGTDVNILNNTAIHTALISQQFDCFKLLVDLGADISSRDYELFHNALFYSSSTQSPEFLDKLLEQDIKIQKKDIDKILKTALEFSDETIAKILAFAKKATIEPKNSNKKTKSPKL